MSFMRSARVLARTGFSPVRGPGVMLMLACYLDDSGTHANSQVMVWGGMVGLVDDFERLERAWLELLQEPYPGRRPIHAFHATDLERGDKAFSEFSWPERQHIRFRFRQAINASGIMVVGHAVDAKAWQQAVSEFPEGLMDGPERFALGKSVADALMIEEVNGQGMTIYLDKGAMEPGRRGLGLQSILQVAREVVPEGDRSADVLFSEVNFTPCLQAADMVAWEFYQYAKNWIAADKAGQAEPHPNPHFADLLINAYDSSFQVMNEGQIRAECRRRYDDLRSQQGLG